MTVLATAGDLRGAVLRVAYRLFREALRFRQDLIGNVEFIDLCHALIAAAPRVVIYSERETAVFRAWSRQQLDAAVENYREQKRDARGVLRWRDAAGRTYAG